MSISTPLFSPGVGRVVVSPIDDGVSAVSTVLVTRFNVVDRVTTATRAFSWKIKAQGISTQKAFAFNARKRMSVYPQYIKYGMDHPVVWPIDKATLIPGIAWSIDNRFSAKVKFSWKVIDRISSKKKIYFNVRIIRHTNHAFSWNALLKVSKPGVTANPSWHNRVLAPTTHPIDNASHKVSSYMQFNTAKRISRSQAMRFNYRIKRAAYLDSSFSVVNTRVVCRKDIQWETLMRL